MKKRLSAKIWRSKNMLVCAWALLIGFIRTHVQTVVHKYIHRTHRWTLILNYYHSQMIFIWKWSMALKCISVYLCTLKQIKNAYRDRAREEVIRNLGYCSIKMWQKRYRFQSSQWNKRVLRIEIKMPYEHIINLF